MGLRSMVKELVLQHENDLQGLSQWIRDEIINKNVEDGEIPDILMKGGKLHGRDYVQMQGTRLDHVPIYNSRYYGKIGLIETRNPMSVKAFIEFYRREQLGK